MKRILDIIPLGTRKFNDNRKKLLANYASKDFSVDVVSLPYGTHSIESHYDESLNTPYIVEEIKKAEKNGYDAVIVDCFIDPGVAAGREIAKIPVVGPGEAALHIASILGTRFSILTVAGLSLTKMLFLRVRALGLLDNLASVRNIGLMVLEIEKERENAFNRLLAEGRKAIKEDDAEVLVLGCTGLAGFAKRLQKKLKVPVVDPILVAIKVAEVLVSTGLSQSKLMYPSPPKKAVTYPPQ